MNIKNSEGVLKVDVVCLFVRQLWSVWPIQYLFLSFSLTLTLLRCNLLFGLIGHFGLLKDVNISFFLSQWMEQK